MKQDYEEVYHVTRHNNLYEDSEYYFVRARVSVYEYFRGLVKKYEKVLEYGCGLGQNIYLIRNAVGYDESKFAVEFCRRKGINSTNKIKSLKEGSFDIVLCCEVLEHLEEPLKALKEINSKLKNGGKLILVLPIDKWNKPDIYDENQHLYNWNFNTIINLLLRSSHMLLRSRKPGVAMGGPAFWTDF